MKSRVSPAVVGGQAAFFVFRLRFWRVCKVAVSSYRYQSLDLYCCKAVAFFVYFEARGKEIDYPCGPAATRRSPTAPPGAPRSLQPTWPLCHHLFRTTVSVSSARYWCAAVCLRTGACRQFLPGGRQRALAVLAACLRLTSSNAPPPTTHSAHLPPRPSSPVVCFWPLVFFFLWPGRYPPAEISHQQVLGGASASRGGHHLVLSSFGLGR